MVAKTALFAILRHNDRDVLCRTVKQVLDMLEQQGIEVDLQGFMKDDDCWRVEY